MLEKMLCFAYFLMFAYLFQTNSSTVFLLIILLCCLLCWNYNKIIVIIIGVVLVSPCFDSACLKPLIHAQTRVLQKQQQQRAHTHMPLLLLHNPFEFWALLKPLPGGETRVATVFQSCLVGNAQWRPSVSGIRLLSWLCTPCNTTTGGGLFFSRFALSFLAPLLKHRGTYWPTWNKDWGITCCKYAMKIHLCVSIK